MDFSKCSEGIDMDDWCGPTRYVVTEEGWDQLLQLEKETTATRKLERAFERYGHLYEENECD